MLQTNKIFNANCIDVMKSMQDAVVNLTLTDIPYAEVNRLSNGLRVMDKADADVMTFDLKEFLEEVYRITSSTIIVFCGQHQLSDIITFFQDKQNKGKGTVRQLIWEKTNPSPMNGQHIYISGIENAVWFKKRGGTFNAHCKNTVFKYPCGRSKLHPTEKNHNLLKELILDNSNEGDLVFDPCCGSGSHCLVAKECGRQYIGVELQEKYYTVARDRLNTTTPYKIKSQDNRYFFCDKCNKSNCSEDANKYKKGNKTSYIEIVPIGFGMWVELPCGCYKELIRKKVI